MVLYPVKQVKLARIDDQAESPTFLEIATILRKIRPISRPPTHGTQNRLDRVMKYVLAVDHTLQY